MSLLANRIRSHMHAKDWTASDLRRACIEAGAPKRLTLQTVLYWLDGSVPRKGPYRTALQTVLAVDSRVFALLMADIDPGVTSEAA